MAALVSYRHLSGLLGHYGEDAVTVTVGPLAVDGLMLMATGALLATGRPTAATAASATQRTPGRDGDVPEAAWPQATATLDTTTRTGDGRTASATATAARRRRVRPSSPLARQADMADDIAAKAAAIVADRSDVTAGDVAAEIGRAPRMARRYLAARPRQPCGRVTELVPRHDLERVIRVPAGCASGPVVLSLRGQTSA
ncbi:hypothetical protein [Micromonospora sp. NPDC007230]|uniref:hypothetical protein n=1 Tax=Micromonospora sp. NPDC007230 TaxID=3364237 RepID=UPI0036937B02